VRRASKENEADVNLEEGVGPLGSVHAGGPSNVSVEASSNVRSGVIGQVGRVQLPANLGTGSKRLGRAQGREWRQIRLCAHRYQAGSYRVHP
jgi:hypothetical protein